LWSEGLRAYASFIQAFSPSPEEVPAYSDAGAAEQLLGWQESRPLVLTGRLRYRQLLLERSPIGFFMTTMFAVPAIIGKSWLSGAIGIGAVFIGLVGWFISGWVRPRLIFEPGTRFLTWRLRGLEVRLRWTSIESARTGKGLVVQTEAGPLRVPLRRRTAERRIDAAIEALERHFPSDEATARPSATWPAGFIAALDCIDFKAATPIILRFLCGRLTPIKFILLLMAEIALACGILAIAPPPTVVLISLVALIGWPLLFAVREVDIERGTRTLIVRIRRDQSREKLTPAMLAVGTYGDSMTAESAVIIIQTAEHTLILLPSGTEERAVEAARRALLAFSGIDALEGEK
jgi:hypothetical protein